jgi:hypothetical protein
MAATASASKSTFSRYVLPVVLFMAVVGVIAWLTQYMPTWHEQAQVKQGEPATDEVVKFSRARGAWELDEKGEDTGYTREFERGVEGRYYFPFKNVLKKTAELGLMRVSCDCTYAEIALLPAAVWSRIDDDLKEKPWLQPHFDQEPAWQKITPSELEGVAIPPEGRGIARITWKGKKSTGEQLRILLTMWSQPEKDLSGRKFELIGVPVLMANPVMSDPAKQTVGVLGPGDIGKAEFTLWSATRDPGELDLGVANTDPLFHSELKPLDDAACKSLQEKLVKNKILTKVRAAYALTVTVSEQKDGKQMDQGPFVRTVPIILDQLPDPAGGPQVTGLIKGEVVVGAHEDQGKIQFKSFAARDGARRVVPIWTPAGVKLEIAEHYPAALQVKLATVEKETTAQKVRWNLELVIPPNGVIGAFPEHSAITLRILTNPPRLIRIPLTGNAGSGQG